MAEADVLAFLRENFTRVFKIIEPMRDDVRDLKVRVTAVEEALAGVNRRIDRLEAWQDRTERRLELVDDLPQTKPA